MRTLEEKYNDINGSNFENEAAKILLRYKNEGRPDQRLSQEIDNRKQVRFEQEHEQEIS